LVLVVQPHQQTKMAGMGQTLYLTLLLLLAAAVVVAVVEVSHSKQKLVVLVVVAHSTEVVLLEQLTKGLLVQQVEVYSLVAVVELVQRQLTKTVQLAFLAT
jgi:hypothetical protein